MPVGLVLARADPTPGEGKLSIVRREGKRRQGINPRFTRLDRDRNIFIDVARHMFEGLRAALARDGPD